MFACRAWPSKAAETELLKLTAKILLDSQTNLKSIQLAFTIVQVHILSLSLFWDNGWILFHGIYFY
jgi:hypothetical protein